MDPENQSPIPNTPQPIQPSVPEILPTGINVEQAPVANETPKPKNNSIILLAVFLVLVSLGSLGFWAYKNYFASSPVALPQPTAQVVVPTATPDPTANWKTYTNSVYNYSVKYPSDFTIFENGMGGGDIQKATAIFITSSGNKKVESPALGITVRSDTSTLESVATKHYQKLITNILTESEKQTASKNLGYAVSDNKATNVITTSTFLGFPSFQFTINGSTIDDGASEYGVPSETHHYIWFEANKKFFLISFTKTTIMDQILSTFKFFVSPSATPITTYICPPNGYIDCMPVLDATKQKACSAEAMAWYKANCPNFKGGAY